MPTPAVSNTSPIWNLASIGLLELLQEQFSLVYIPDDVWRELHAAGDGPELRSIQGAEKAQWLKVASLKSPHVQQSLMLELHSGEAAAIALALEMEISRILMDETEGRSAAKIMGLHPTGILGILLRAKNDGKIISVSDEMIRLRHEAGFFISDSLFQHVQRVAGE